MAADIVTLAESRLTSTDLDECYAVDDFQLLRNDQVETSSNQTRPPHDRVCQLPLETLVAYVSAICPMAKCDSLPLRQCQTACAKPFISSMQMYPMGDLF